jgi:hypothetical protein
MGLCFVVSVYIATSESSGISDNASDYTENDYRILCRVDENIGWVIDSI